MSIYIEDGVLHVDNAEEKLRHKGKERPEFLKDYTLIDIETTGLYPSRDHVTEMGGIKVRNNEVVAKYSQLVKYPDRNHVPSFITKLNGITETKILQDGLMVDQAIKEFRKFIADDIIVGYNINFDLNFIYDLTQKYNLPTLNNDYVDVLRFARLFYPRQKNRLIDCMKRAGIAQVEQHRGLDDSLDTKKVYDDFAKNASPEIVEKAGRQIKNFSLTEDELMPWQLGFSNPVKNKTIALSPNLAMNQHDITSLIYNLSGEVSREVTGLCDYLLVADSEFFDQNNPQIETLTQLNHQGAAIKKLSETFFLSMLDDWARR